MDDLFGSRMVIASVFVARPSTLPPWKTWHYHPRWLLCLKFLGWCSSGIGRKLSSTAGYTNKLIWYFSVPYLVPSFRSQNWDLRCWLNPPGWDIQKAEVQAHSIGALLVEAIAGTPKQQTRRAGGGNLPEVIAKNISMIEGQEKSIWDDYYGIANDYEN